MAGKAVSSVVTPADGCTRNLWMMVSRLFPSTRSVFLLLAKTTMLHRVPVLPLLPQWLQTSTVPQRGILYGGAQAAETSRQVWAAANSWETNSASAVMSHPPFGQTTAATSCASCSEHLPSAPAGTPGLTGSTSCRVHSTTDRFCSRLKRLKTLSDAACPAHRDLGEHPSGWTM